ncbi:putative ubiquitin 1 [Schistosoma mansoni]|uniref:putative ubiquitin 1 n=1 Tax=Schistosoma mansoni TaxID=6183 RepID=UPI0001A636A0|nr:putative ubiquitin 1 [Schistosoma mansoni]|eukprot:XP_018652969.1 putative ubiquitin 1 [Schistosoma mansoni]
MLIFIRGLSGAVTPLNVSPHESVLSIKIRIFYLKSIPTHDQHLLYSGVELTDQTILSTVNIGHGALLLLVLGLRTGPLGRYDLCTSINQKYSNNDISSQSSINNNNNDETEYTRLLSLLSSSCSYSSVSSSSSSAPTVVFPSICVTPVVNATKITSNELEQTETNLLMNSFESYNDNNDDTINSNCFTSSDDEISRIAEILGYAIDNNEQLLSPSLYDFPTTVTDDSQLYDYDNCDIDGTDIYYDYEQSFSPSQQLNWLLTPSYNFTQHLNIPETNSYELCENINSNNSSRYIHGFKTIEAPSERCQSTDSLLGKTDTSTPTTSSTNTVLNSSYNSRFSSLKESYSSLPNINVLVDNDNNNSNNLTMIDVSKSTCNSDETTVIIGHNDDDDDDCNSNRHDSNSPIIPLLNTTITNLPILSGDNTVMKLLKNSTINFMNNFQSTIIPSCSYSFYITMQIKLLLNNPFHSNEHASNLIPTDNTVVMPRKPLYTNKSFESPLNQHCLPQITKTHSNNLNNNEYHITEKLLNHTRRYNRQTEFNFNCNDNNDLGQICYECNRRTRLACGFTCRCERWFCSRHHHPEDHKCNFKFKTTVN